MPEDYTPEPDERDIDPVAQASATASLTEQMRREEAALSAVTPSNPMWTPMPRPVAPPRTTTYGMVSPPTPPNYTRPFTDTSGQVHYGEMAQELGRVNQAMMAQQKFEAQKGYASDIAAGKTPQEAFNKWGPMLFGKANQPPRRYNVAGVGLVDESGNVITPRPQTTSTRTVPGVGLVDAQTGKVIVPIPVKPETQTITEKIPATEAIPPTAAQAARKGFLGIGARPAIPATPGVPGQPERTISRKVPIESPVAAAAPERVTTKAQFDALPKGTIYVGEDGKRYRKP